MVRRIVLTLILAAEGVAFLVYRLSHPDYAGERPAGYLFGAAAYLLVVTTAAVRLGARWRRPWALFRSDHCFFGVAAAIAAGGHVAFRFHNAPGLLSLGLLAVVIAGYCWRNWRRSPAVRWIHRWGGYALLVVGLAHGLLALLRHGY